MEAKYKFNLVFVSIWYTWWAASWQNILQIHTNKPFYELNFCNQPFFWLIHKTLIKYSKKQSRISYPVAFVIVRLVLQKILSKQCNIKLKRRCRPTKHGSTSLQNKLYLQGGSGVKLSTILRSCSFRWTVNWKFNWTPS